MGILCFVADYSILFLIEFGKKHPKFISTPIVLGIHAIFPTSTPTSATSFFTPLPRPQNFL